MKEKFRKKESYLDGIEGMGNVDDFDDHGVKKIGSHLDGKNICVLVTSGIAAEKVPSLVRHYRHYGANVHIYVTPDAFHNVTEMNLQWSSLNPVVSELSYKSEHLIKNIDAYVVCPATANTIAKFAHGIGDNVVTTTLISALGRLEAEKSKIIVVPTMHGSMFNSIVKENLDSLVERGVSVMAPNYERGKLNIPGSHEIVARTIREISQSNLKGKSILLTAGPTPGWIDDVRYITNRFRGRLGVVIAEEAYLRGANIQLILGPGGINAPKYIPTENIDSYDEYKVKVLETLQKYDFDAGIFSAAVADYVPKQKVTGKIKSKGGLNNLELKETDKVIDLVRQEYPKLYMATFKFVIGMTPKELEDVSMARTKSYELVVANRGEEMTAKKQHSIIYDTNGKVSEGFTKQEIASKLLDVMGEKL
jgi:phosphopantothenoylcysteine decarboxylase/phosphopantothenate--cysteine ligase